jgi:hypothetical protein
MITTPGKRPASHWWVIGISGFMTLGFVCFIINIITGRASVSPITQYWRVLAFLSCCALTLISILLGRRQKWTYYVTSALLAAYTFRAIYTSFLIARYFIFTGASYHIPYFHLAEGDKPFVVQQQISSSKQILMIVATGFLIWLFLRFAIGRPSRSYYQFKLPENVGG